MHIIRMATFNEFNVEVECLIELSSVHVFLFAFLRSLLEAVSDHASLLLVEGEDRALPHTNSCSKQLGC